MAAATIARHFERERGRKEQRTSSSSSDKGKYLSTSLSPREEEKMIQILAEEFKQNNTNRRKRRRYEKDDDAPVSRERVKKELTDAALLSAAADTVFPISNDLIDIVHNLVNEGKTY